MATSQGIGSALGLSVFLATIFLAAAEQHQVGGPPGWSIPSLAGVNYTVWAGTQTFTIGDTLYFNYSSAYHNVLEVTEANYKSCAASNPEAEWTSGADVIPLNSSGTFYYICGIPGHCGQGQKVAVEVTGAAATGKQHQVGGAPGWSLPSRSNVNYTVWASTQTFVVGDTLYFNYSSQNHNVMEVSKSDYDACNASDPIQQWDDGATIVPLSSAGTFYYICGVSGHCAAGQKFAATVLETATVGSPASPPAGEAGGGSGTSRHMPSVLLGTFLAAASFRFLLSCGSSMSS